MLIKSQQELIKSIKSQQKLTKQTKSQKELIKSQNHNENKKKHNKPYPILKKLGNKNELENSNKLDEKIINNNDDFRQNVRDLFNIENNNELDKKINNNNNDDFIENVRDLFNIENSNELDKKINNDDFIENVRDLFSVLYYEPVLIKPGFDGNYLEYMSNGSNSLSFDEYLELIRPYLGDLINVYKTKGE